jgi:hypothetical protein
MPAMGVRSTPALANRWSGVENDLRNEVFASARSVRSRSLGLRLQRSMPGALAHVAHERLSPDKSSVDQAFRFAEQDHGIDVRAAAFHPR